MSLAAHIIFPKVILAANLIYLTFMLLLLTIDCSVLDYWLRSLDFVL